MLGACWGEAYGNLCCGGRLGHGRVWDSVTSLNEVLFFIARLTEMWCLEMDQMEFEGLARSMLRRIAAILLARGGDKKY